MIIIMINYIASSNKDKKPLVFIHGIASTSLTFIDQIKNFEKNYYVLSLDLPGFGKSKTLRKTTIYNYANAIYKFLILNKIKKPILIGHSLGGMIVQKIITEHLNYAKAAVLIATSSKFGSSNTSWQNNFIESRLKPLNEGKMMKDIAYMAIFNIIGPKKNEQVIKFAEKIMSSISEESYRAAIMSLIGFDVRKKLPLIKIPTLLISGEFDKQAPAKTMLSMSKKIIKSQYIEIEDSGHLIHLEKTEIFNKIVKKFIINL